jgi:phenylacetate-CoA ligase
MEFFDQKVETASREQIGMLQFQKLEALLKRVCATNPFYRSKFESFGITPSDIRSLDDLQKLPFTLKKNLRKIKRDILYSGPILQSRWRIMSVVM